MMKRLTYILLFLASCTLSLNAQIPLFKGIKSGQNQNDLYRFLYKNPDFAYHQGDRVFYYTTSIYGKDYLLRAGFNIYGELYVVDFISDLCYESVYSDDLNDNLQEVFGMMKARYGVPGYDGLEYLSELSDGCEQIIYQFGREPDMAAIKVEKNDDGTYSVVVAFEDFSFEKFAEEVPVNYEQTVIYDDTDNSGDGF